MTWVCPSFRVGVSFRAVLLVNCSQNGQLGTVPKSMHIWKKSQLVYGRGSFKLLVHIASPTSPPYVGTQLTALFHTQPLLKCLVYGIAAPTVNYTFQLKPSPALQAPGHCHQLGLAYGYET